MQSATFKGMLMKYKQLSASIIWSFLLCLPSTNAQAVAVCVGNESHADFHGSLGDFQGGLLFRWTLSSIDPACNSSIVFTSTGDFIVDVIGPYSMNTDPWKNWQTVTMGSAALPQRITASINGADYTTSTFTGYARTLETGTLNLTKVNWVSPDVKLRFAGVNNVLNLSDSSMNLAGGLEAVGTAPFTINSLSGANEFISTSGIIDAQSTNINVNPGSSLTFTTSGKVEPTVFTERLYFRNNVTGLVDNATLEFDRSDVYFFSDQFQFVNGSILSLSGWKSRANFENVSIINSQVDSALNTIVQADGTMKLEGATLNLSSGSAVNAHVLEIVTDSTINGEAYDPIPFNSGFNSFVTTPNLEILPGQTLTQNGAWLTADNIWIEAGSTVNVANKGNLTTSTVYAVGGGSTINVTGESQLSVVDNKGGFKDRAFRDLTINVDSTSQIVVDDTSALTTSATLGSETIFNNAGRIIVSGEFNGSGTVNGTGKFIMNPGSILSPGDATTYQNFDSNINTITFENSLDFSGAYYWPDVAMNAGSPINDRIEYIDNDIDLRNQAGIQVNVRGLPGATALHGQSFTVMSSRDAASTGTILTSFTPHITEAGSVPALIDFSVVDLNTNGHPDVTLVATNKGYTALTTHPGVSTVNHQATSALLVNAAVLGHTTVQQSLNNMTNAQAAPHLDSFHPEPYSSNMTVALEHTDMVMNTVLNHASFEDVFSTGTSNKDTHKRIWMDASYAKGSIDGTNDLAGFEYSLSSFVMGKNLVERENSAYGAYFSFGRRSMDEHEIATQNFRSDDYHLGLYLNQEGLGPWDVRAIVGAAYGDNSSNRGVSLGHLSSLNEADFSSHSLYGGVKGTTLWYEGPMAKLSMELGLNYIYYGQKSFEEVGDHNLALALDSANAQTVTTTIGIDAKFPSITSSVSLKPLAFLRYEHDWYANRNSEHKIDAALASHPNNKQQFVGQNRGAHAVSTGIGLSSDVASLLQVNGGLFYSRTSNGDEWGMGLNVKYGW